MVDRIFDSGGVGGARLLSLAPKGWYDGRLGMLSRLVLIPGALGLIFSPLLSLAGASGFILNALGAAILIATRLVRCSPTRDRDLARMGLQ